LHNKNKRCIFVLSLTTKQIKMKALVKVNGESVGMFYQMTNNETQAQMHSRILNVIVYRYGICGIDIQWQA
jgi:hypothetical protein